MMKYILYTLILFCLSIQASFSSPCQNQWERFKETFISPDGRVIDYQNEQITHSEGQGFSLLAALICNDQSTFDTLLQWSENNLGKGLKAWKWGFDGTEWTVLDQNNATDADILHAWALLKASEKWHDKRYSENAKNIIALLKDCCINSNGFISPGRLGFTKPEGRILNTSYYIFPALNDFIKLDPDNALLWKKTITTGLRLITMSRDPHSGLPTDWIFVKNDHSVSAYPKDTFIFAYEAIRIPLYLSAAGYKNELNIFKNLVSELRRKSYMPACISHEVVESCTEEAGYGFYAIMARTAKDLGLNYAEAHIQSIYTQKNNDPRRYYDAILSLLSLIL